MVVGMLAASPAGATCGWRHGGYLEKQSSPSGLRRGRSIGSQAALLLGLASAWCWWEEPGWRVAVLPPGMEEALEAGSVGF